MSLGHTIKQLIGKLQCKHSKVLIVGGREGEIDGVSSPGGTGPTGLVCFPSGGRVLGG